MTKLQTIIITLNDDDEYRVPGPKRTEAQAYYTNDREDALNTARHIYGDAVILRIKRVRG